MDYSSILKQLVGLSPDRAHCFLNAWPNGEKFPTDLGDEFLVGSGTKTIFPKNATIMTTHLYYGGRTFVPMTNYKADLTIYNGNLEDPSDNSGLPYGCMRETWKDFSIDNPIIPQIINRGMAIIHGANWQDRISTEILYEVATTINKPFVNMKKL